MPYTFQKLPKSCAEFSFTIPVDEIQPFLIQAAERLSQKSTIPGFRPGKAPYDMIMKRFGEMAIWEEALEHIVRKHYANALAAESLETIGSPEINVEKLAPGNPLAFKIKTSLVPEIDKLADYSVKKFDRKTPEIEDKKIDKVIEDVRKMQTKEKLVDRPATAADKVVIEMEMTQNGVIMEGGKSPNFQVYLAEENYIPGLTRELVGLKSGDEKKFTLKFPDQHFQKSMQGKNVDFRVKATGVYELEPPEINDEFAKTMGQPDLAAMKKLIRENLVNEAAEEEERRLERAIFDDLISASRFGDMPDLLVNEEINKMLHELEHNAEHQGMKFEDYLASIKKTVADLKIDFAAEAMRRIKAALLLRVISQKEKIDVEEKDVDQEIDRQAETYKDNDDARKQIFSPEYRDYIFGALRNRKVIEMLKKNMIR
ncbi:MAG: trigger factor [Patescibacteria group bacterium]|nr:trigger factor [Patescibacteria group bacterium]